MSIPEISEKELAEINLINKYPLNNFDSAEECVDWSSDIIPRLIIALEHKKAELDAVNLKYITAIKVIMRLNGIIALAKELPKSVLRRYPDLQQALHELDNETK